MIATRHPSGQIVLIPEADETPPIPEAAHYDVAIASSGNIMLRPKRRHQRALIEHFAALQGLEIPHRLDPIPEPPQL